MSSINNSGRKSSETPKAPSRSSSLGTTEKSSAKSSEKGTATSFDGEKSTDSFKKESRSDNKKSDETKASSTLPSIKAAYSKQMNKSHKQQRKEVADVARKVGKGASDVAKTAGGHAATAARVASQGAAKAGQQAAKAGAAAAGVAATSAKTIGTGVAYTAAGSVAATAAVANFLGMPSLVKGIGALLGAAALSVGWLLNNTLGPVIGTVGHALAGMAKAVFDAPGKAISDAKAGNKEIKAGYKALGFSFPDRSYAKEAKLLRDIEYGVTQEPTSKAYRDEARTLRNIGGPHEEFADALSEQPREKQKAGRLPEVDLGPEFKLA